MFEKFQTSWRELYTLDHFDEFISANTPTPCPECSCICSTTCKGLYTVRYQRQREFLMRLLFRPCIDSAVSPELCVAIFSGLLLFIVHIQLGEIPGMEPSWPTSPSSIPRVWSRSRVLSSFSFFSPASSFSILQQLSAIRSSKKLYVLIFPHDSDQFLPVPYFSYCSLPLIESLPMFLFSWPNLSKVDR